MDLGCYTVSFARFVAGEPEVVSAEIEQGPPNVDVDTRAELRFPGGVTGSVYCSMKADKKFRAAVEVLGERGVLHVTNPLAPHFGHELKLRVGDGESSEKVLGEATYVHQLRAFADHVRKGVPVPTGPDDAVANMRVIDAIYRAAGLPPRGT
jgi:predicted dehydrogenase